MGILDGGLPEGESSCFAKGKRNGSKGGNIMAKSYLRALSFLAVSLLFIGCASQKTKPSQPAFIPYEFPMAGYEQKVDNFLVILDASGSMGKTYKEQRKFHLAKEVARRMNQTIPDLELTGALRTLGQGRHNKTVLVYGPKPFEKAEFGEALNAVNWGGDTPLADAINKASGDLESIQGEIAVVILSDGKETAGSALEAAKAMKSRYGDRLCIYTVVIGDDPEGKGLMEQIARVGECGYSINADEIYPSAGMASFAENVFLEPLAVAARLDSDGDGVSDDLDQCPDTPRGVAVDTQGCPLDRDGDGVADYLDKCPDTARGAPVDAEGCPLDSDGDGVADYLDQCPETPKGATVNRVGCWALEGVVLFDFDSDDIKPEAYPLLNEVLTILKKNPQLSVEIQGHTDNVGSAEYNQTLSEERAQAVMDYLVKNGIDPQRVSSTGYGLTRPVASNDTDEGRAKNRRVELRRR
jgi:OOP family OmpA-OmpF porin